MVELRAQAIRWVDDEYGSEYFTLLYGMAVLAAEVDEARHGT